MEGWETEVKVKPAGTVSVMVTPEAALKGTLTFRLKVSDSFDWGATSETFFVRSTSTKSVGVWVGVWVWVWVGVSVGVWVIVGVKVCVGVCVGVLVSVTV